MLSLRAPKVTSYFIRHVDLKSLKVRPGEEGTKVKIGLFAGDALGISKGEMYLGSAADKIRTYQETFKTKHSLDRLPAASKKYTAGEHIFSIWGITTIVYSMFPLTSNLNDPKGVIFSFLGLTIYWGTRQFAKNRRLQADNLLHYFVEANSQPVKPE